MCDCVFFSEVVLRIRGFLFLFYFVHLYFQLWKLTVLPLAVQTRFVRKMLVFPYVSVTLVIKATDTIVQVRKRGTCV